MVHMRPSPSRHLRLRLLAVLVALGGGVLAACSGAAAPAQPPANQGLVLNRPTPQHVALTNQSGQSVSLASLRGKLVVLAPFLSLCQDECPLVTGAFISLQHSVEAAGAGKKVVFVETTVDPGRDTVARLAAYQKEFGADWDLWTGSAAAIAAFWKPFGVSYQIVPEAQPAKIDWYTGKTLTYDVNHTDGYFLIDAQGHERFSDSNPPDLHGHLDRKLTGLLNAGGLKNLDDQSLPNWTLSQALASLSWLVGRTIPSVAST